MRRSHQESSYQRKEGKQFWFNPQQQVDKDLPEPLPRCCLKVESSGGRERVRERERGRKRWGERKRSRAAEEDRWIIWHVPGLTSDLSEIWKCFPAHVECSRCRTGCCTFSDFTGAKDFFYTWISVNFMFLGLFLLVFCQSEQLPGDPAKQPRILTFTTGNRKKELQNRKKVGNRLVTGIHGHCHRCSVDFFRFFSVEYSFEHSYH